MNDPLGQSFWEIEKRHGMAEVLVDAFKKASRIVLHHAPLIVVKAPTRRDVLAGSSLHHEAIVVSSHAPSIPF
ncbi:hypothetical protein [Bradyrhizobium sp. CCBAU 65884]|uniref:hypothetical protein n=1 Tax=Bradyrhizobium sp. CCBAU 65884 TaxID=722477 RepID=UPI002305BA16|nr:hypothetical protein [Bradyrhizobium sp. CCBAU 65884]